MTAHPAPWSLADVEARVRAAVHAGLPGLDAQLRMAPRPRPGWYRTAWPADVRRAAALVLLFPAGSGPAIVLTVRSRALPTHPGQVSLPGGAVEEGETLDVAALREAHEEIALDPHAARIVAPLTPLHIPVSGFALHPIVAVSESRPALRAADGEVARILEVPVADLADPASVRRSIDVREGREYDVPSFAVAGERVWGATAMVLAELLWVIGCAPDPWMEG